MLTDLESLRTSVGNLATVFHPWVRNMGRQDRLIVFIDPNGFPQSVALVLKDDAKQLVTIAKDNHNAFPAFRIKDRSLSHVKRFCFDLMPIYTNGPMADLLRAVAKIEDDEVWFARVDQLLAETDIDAEKRSLETLAVDLSEGAVLSPDMRSVLSNALFGYEEMHVQADDKMPNPNLPVLGLTYLMSKNPDIPSFARYGLTGLDSFRLDRQSAREMAASLEWITTAHRKGKTWQSVPGATKDQRDLMIVFLNADPDSRAQLADFFGDVEKEHEPRNREEQEACYTALCESVGSFFDRQTGSTVRGEFLDLMLLRKVSPGVTRIETHLQPSIEKVKASIRDWLAALGNTPPSTLRPRHLVPGQVVRTLQRQWIRKGEDFNDARFELKTVYNLLFRTEEFSASALLFLEAAYKHGKQLLQSGRRIQPVADYFTAVGIALYYRGHNKEAYMEGTAYKLGEFLAMADLVHRCYCQEVRDGAMPPNLIGNAHFDAASSNPSSALALMQSRLKLYTGWAQTRGGSLAKWTLKRLGEISSALAGNLPTKLSTDEKAQMLLGYLARAGGDNTKRQEEAHAEA